MSMSTESGTSDASSTTMPMTSIRSLIQSFGDEERDSWFQELVDALSLQDRLKLSALISKRNDPLEILPEEVVLHFFNYLPLFDAWRLQQVCRSWRNVLSSHSLQRGLLARWERHGPGDTARPRGQPPQQSIADKLHHIQAWRLGLPLSKAEIPKSFARHQGWHYDKSKPTQAQRTLALDGRRIAFLDSDLHLGDAVVVRDLTQEAFDQRLQAIARDKIMVIVLTEKLVAWITFSARLHVQTLPVAAGQTKTMQLPSAGVTAFHADGSLIGLVAARGREDTSLLLLLYSHVTGKLVHHAIERPSPGSKDQEHLRELGPDGTDPGDTSEEDVLIPVWSAPSSILVNERRGTIDLFYETTTYRRCGKNMGNLQMSIWLKHQRYRIKSGTVEESTSEPGEIDETLRIPVLLRLSSSLPVAPSVSSFAGVVVQPSSIGTRDQWCFGSCIMAPRQRDRLSKCFVPIFDADAGMLCVHQHTLEGLFESGSLERVSLWKDTLQLFNGSRTTMTTFTANEYCLPPKSQSQYTPRTSCKFFEDEGIQLLDSVCNDSFMVAAIRNNKAETEFIAIWCFETAFEWSMATATTCADESVNELSTHAFGRQIPTRELEFERDYRQPQWRIFGTEPFADYNS